MDDGSVVWTAVVESDDVAPSAIVAVEVGDRQLVVWRTAHGEAVVCDARCPHQWSHLEGEGVVDGDELVCTAHFWRFDAAGHGTKLNVKGRRDDKSDVEVFPSRVVGDMIEVGIRIPDTAVDATRPTSERHETNAEVGGSKAGATGTTAEGSIVRTPAGPGRQADE